jgi:hypothetical protein
MVEREDGVVRQMFGEQRRPDVLEHPGQVDGLRLGQPKRSAEFDLRGVQRRHEEPKALLVEPMIPVGLRHAVRRTGR